MEDKIALLKPGLDAQDKAHMRTTLKRKDARSAITSLAFQQLFFPPLLGQLSSHRWRLKTLLT